jgi:hypothetical protein
MKCEHLFNLNFVIDLHLNGYKIHGLRACAAADKFRSEKMNETELSRAISALTGGGVAGICLLLSLYIFRDTILAALGRSVQRDLESKKAEFQKELEEWKSELESQKERLKHDLSKDALKTKLITEKTHTVYTKLFELLRIAEGNTGKLTGLRIIPDWKYKSDDEIRNILKDRGASDSEIQIAINGIDRSDSFNGYKSVQDAYLHIDTFDSMKGVIEARNFAIINELYLSSDVGKIVFDLTNMMNGVRINIQYAKEDSSLYRKAHEESELVRPKMQELMKKMREELGNL